MASPGNAFSLYPLGPSLVAHLSRHGSAPSALWDVLTSSRKTVLHFGGQVRRRALGTVCRALDGAGASQTSCSVSHFRLAARSFVVNRCWGESSTNRRVPLLCQSCNRPLL